MTGGASLYIMNDSDSHIQLKDDMMVAVGQEVIHIEEVSESDGLLLKWNGQSVLNHSNGSLHLDGIIGVEEEDNPLLTENSGTFTSAKHHIDTGNSRPIKQRMQRTPLGYANEEQEHLENLLKAVVIEPSCSESASPSVLVRSVC